MMQQFSVVVLLVGIIAVTFAACNAQVLVRMLNHLTGQVAEQNVQYFNEAAQKARLSKKANYLNTGALVDGAIELLNTNATVIVKGENETESIFNIQPDAAPPVVFIPLDRVQEVRESLKIGRSEQSAFRNYLNNVPRLSYHDNEIN